MPILETPDKLLIVYIEDDDFLKMISMINELEDAIFKIWNITAKRD